MVQFGRLLSEAGVCHSVVDDNNMFTIKQGDIEQTNLSVGDPVQVIVVKTTSDEKDISLTERLKKAANSNRFSGTILPNNEVMIDNQVANALDLENGDKITYLVLPSTDDIPTLKGGFLRNKLSGSDNDAEGIERPDREAFEATYSGMSMASTGQITVPSSVRDKLGLISGDFVDVSVEHEGQQSKMFSPKVDTQNRITVTNEVMENLGLEQGDKPTIHINVRGE